MARPEDERSWFNSPSAAISSSSDLARILDTQERLEHALRRIASPAGRSFIERRLTEVRAEEARERTRLVDAANGPDRRSHATPGPQ